MGNIEISVLLITYNADWPKLKMTIESILRQQEIAYEIIIADDGSSKRWDEAIDKLCEEYQFHDYKLINAKENGGTVKNLYNAVQVAQGEYSKAISPADMLYDATTLRKWVDFMKAQQAQLSFGDAVYYNCGQDGKVNILEQKPAPANFELFDEPQNRQHLFENYLLANDTMLGAAIMMRTDAMTKYLSRFVGKVKFAEDFMARVMVFENQKVSHYPGNVVWYEYGLGASTSKSERWVKLLYEDFEASNEIIRDASDAPDEIAKKYLIYLTKDIKKPSLRKIYKCMMFPGMIRWRLQRKNSKNRTSQNVDKRFVEQLFSK